MAGGMIPESLHRFAALSPTCLSHARLKAISLDASEYVALVRSACELCCVNCGFLKLYKTPNLQSMRNMPKLIAVVFVSEPIL